MDVPYVTINVAYLFKWNPGAVALTVPLEGI